MDKANCRNSGPAATFGANGAKTATKLNPPSIWGAGEDGTRTLSRSQQGQRFDGTDGFSAGVCCFWQRCMQQDCFATGAAFAAGAAVLTRMQHQLGGSASSRLEANTSVEL